ncbi:MAG: beta-phosphoglucomutase family hydrolase [Candidatus Hydrothermarchaeaceae archaeon]
MGELDIDFIAAIFDLDGVVVNTVPIHFKAWKQMFEEHGKKFTFQDYKEKVDGIPRIDGGRAILTNLSDEELIEATAKKQRYFLECLKKEKIEVFESTLKLIEELGGKGIKIAVISSSKNLPYILEKIKIIKLFDAKISGNEITKGKPDPQIFLMAAEKMRVKPENCVVFEDAVLGVAAAKRAKMLCIGIDRYNDPSRLKEADSVVSDLKEINYDKLLSLFRRRG